MRCFSTVISQIDAYSRGWDLKYSGSTWWPAGEYTFVGKEFDPFCSVHSNLMVFHSYLYSTPDPCPSSIVLPSTVSRLQDFQTDLMVLVKSGLILLIPPFPLPHVQVLLSQCLQVLVCFPWAHYAALNTTHPYGSIYPSICDQLGSFF